MERIFYVYIYFGIDGIPIYVGKGHGSRWTRRGVHSSRNPHFLRIVAKAERDGIDLPHIKIREYLTESDAFKTEVALIRAIGRRSNGGPLLNLTDGGEGIKGFSHSAETRAKIGASNRGRKQTEEERIKRSVTLKGRPKHPGHGAKVAAALRGIKFTDQRRANISAARKGYKLTPEQLKKRKDTMASPETRAKLRMANLGKKASAAARAKMSASQTARWAERRVA